MRRAFLALFVALVCTSVLALGGSVAGATSVPTGFVQNQVGQNTNKTDQQSQATATTDQWNLNLPISVLSPGANSGDVDQSNRSNTSVFSFNENRSNQGIDQLQKGQITDWGNGQHGLDQSQDANNANETSQDSSAEATTKQANVNVPIAILSPGANSGDVDQSNRADTEVGSGNSNSSDQWIDQSQKGSVDNSGHEPRCDKGCGHDQCSHEKWGKDDGCKPHRPDQGHDKGQHCPCPHEPNSQPHLSQNQQAANSDETHQSSSAKATTKQTNVNKPISILDFGHDGKVRDDGHGKADYGDKGSGHDKEHAGDVHQSNSAGTSVVSHNANDSAQGIHQIQQGGVGGLGGNHSGQPSC